MPEGYRQRMDGSQNSFISPGSSYQHPLRLLITRHLSEETVMIRKLLFACAMLALFISASATAETVIPGGEVYGTWDVFGSPYLIKEEKIIQRVL